MWLFWDEDENEDEEGEEEEEKDEDEEDENEDEEEGEDEGDDEEGEDDSEEVYLITINNKDYYTNNETDGNIYLILDDEDVGPIIGKFKNNKAIFFK